MGRLRIGVQWDTEVTLDDAGHTVTQAFCSALPIAYADHHADRWEPFARLVLDAAYEATLAAAALNARADRQPHRLPDDARRRRLRQPDAAGSSTPSSGPCGASPAPISTSSSSAMGDRVLQLAPLLADRR